MKPLLSTRLGSVGHLRCCTVYPPQRFTPPPTLDAQSHPAPRLPFSIVRGTPLVASPVASPIALRPWLCARGVACWRQVLVERVADTVGWAKEENWACPACAASCFPDRTRCFKCGAPKPTAVAAASPVTTSPAAATTAATVAATAATSPAAAKGLGVAGLWATLAALSCDRTDEGRATGGATSSAGPLASLAGGLGGGGPAMMARAERPPFQCWDEVSRRGNCAVLVRLVDKATDRRFVVATYHMPCLFGSDEKCQVMTAVPHHALLGIQWKSLPEASEKKISAPSQVMTAHVALLMQACQKFSAGAPLVVAGDFNVQPGTPPYSLATTGSLDPAHAQHPPPVTATCGPKVEQPVRLKTTQSSMR